MWITCTLLNLMLPPEVPDWSLYSMQISSRGYTCDMKHISETQLQLMSTPHGPHQTKENPD